MPSVVTGLDLPVIAAPMAGGPGSPALVIAAARAGSLGFLAAGYKAPQALTDEIAAVTAAGVTCGVNLFAPNPVPVDPAAFRRYAELIAPEAARYGLRLDGAAPVEDDDRWHDKLDVLRAHPVPVVSFTFGLPGRDDLALLRRTGALLVQTVTSVLAVHLGRKLAAVADADFGQPLRPGRGRRRALRHLHAGQSAGGGARA